MRVLSLLISLLNVVFPFYGPESLFIISLLLSWSSSTLIESIAFDGLFRRQGYQLRFTAVVGWVSFLQAISTPFSSAVAILIYGGVIWVSPIPQTINILQLSLSLLWNPFGVFFGFFVIPAVFEYLLWRRIWDQNRSTNASVQRLEMDSPSTILLVSIVIIANACSFLFSILLYFNLIPPTFGIPSVLMLVLLIIGFFLWFLYTNQTVVSLRTREESVELANALMEVDTQ